MIPTQIPTDDAVTTLCEVGRRFYTRGWALGTSGNFSAVLSRDPFELAITASAVAKGDLRPSHILHCNDQGRSVCDTPGTPSAEALLHIAIARRRHAGAVLHTHSVWSTLVSDAGAAAGGVAIEGYEMLKGLAGVRTHEHREWIPILENTQDMKALAGQAGTLLRERPQIHGILIRQHGIYTWGKDLDAAARHVEILEFLFESVGRRRMMEPEHENRRRQ
jgi:methylthioribulose-1-phosphate dehydratase